MIEAGLFILDTFLDVLAMMWRFIWFLFGHIPTMIRARS
jgi:hypothetical protein